MSLFNLLRKRPKKMLNRAGGEAFVQSPEMELASLLLCSFAQDQFYRSADDSFKELIQLLTKVDKSFAARAAVYARTKFGMRSITQVLAAELAAYASGEAWAKNFYNAIVKRPDDMLEIVAYYYGMGGKTLPNAMKKGFAKAFNKFDNYQLAKYRGERKQVKLVDLVNLVHPRPTERNAKALGDLVAGQLKVKQTWEAKLAAAGQEANSLAEKEERKAMAWASLIRPDENGKVRLGYFALLRNLRNIAEQAPELIDEVCALLTNKNRIEKSMVLPFRYLTAIEAIKAANLKSERQLWAALSKALDIAMANVPVFEGRTLVVLDDSGSMTWSKNKMGTTPIQIGAIFAAVLYKSNQADLMRFSDDASYWKPFFQDATMSIADAMVKRASNGGTNFQSIFEKAKRAYDRIIILSDMQAWVGKQAPTAALEAYKRKYKVNPFIYSFDLQAYGSLQFPASNVFALAGFSEKVFDVMKLLETDRRVLITAINKIEL